MWWVIHRMACQGAAGWLVGSSYAGNSSAMHRWAQDSGEIPTSLPDFLVNWYLICSWLQNSCLYMLHAVLVRNQAPHFEMPCDFNSQFHTSLAHLMQWKMNTDGFGQDRRIPTCMPVIQLFPTRSVFFSSILLYVKWLRIINSYEDTVTKSLIQFNLNLYNVKSQQQSLLDPKTVQRKSQQSDNLRWTSTWRKWEGKTPF